MPPKTKSAHYARYNAKRIKKTISFLKENERDQRLLKKWDALPNATQWVKQKLEEEAGK